MVKVCIIGAAGGIGQPLSLLLMKNENVTNLALYDICNTAGVAEDLRGVNCSTSVSGYQGDAQLPSALSGSKVIIFVAGVTIKAQQSREALFPVNAKIIAKICKQIHKYAADAFIAIVTNPVNALVPLAVRVLTESGSHQPEKRVFGVTHLDLTRAAVMASRERLIEAPVEGITVPVVGGHDGKTIIPLLSKATPAPKVGRITPLVIEKFMATLQDAGHKVLREKKEGTATLSTAHATERFVNYLLEARAKNQKVYAYAYVKTNIIPGCEYFSGLVEIWTSGIMSVLPLGPLTKVEKDSVTAAIPLIQESVKKAKEVRV